MARALFLFALILAAGSPAANAQGGLPLVWTDVTGSRDMPWLGSGGRARWYERDMTKPWDMDPRGPRIETRWGASGSKGEPPSATGNRAADYLESVGAFRPWPTYPVEGKQRPRRAFPYRVTIVCLEPTIAVMRFDLSAAIEDPIEFSFGAFPASQRSQTTKQRVAGGPIVNSIMFGTSVVAGGSMLWFAPELSLPPTPLELVQGRARITAGRATLEVERRGDEIVFRR